MQLDKANLHNLTSLWRKYGVAVNKQTPCGIYINRDWPRRIWIEQIDCDLDVLNSASRLSSSLKPVLNKVPVGSVFPLFIANSAASNPLSAIHNCEFDVEQFKKILNNTGWKWTFDQVAMYLNLNTASHKKDPALLPDELKLIRVRTQDELNQWIQAAREAFQYEISVNSIKALLNDPDIQILLGQFKGEPAACALLHKTGPIIGLHQMGVRTQFQGRGFATLIMHRLIQLSGEWSGETMVLQASSAGLPLYKKLGFVEQFLIKNYQKTVSDSA